jgi:NTP pyrophosphatase (non-canonical NTP hydrolase)
MADLASSDMVCELACRADEMGMRVFSVTISEEHVIEHAYAEWPRDILEIKRCNEPKGQEMVRQGEFSDADHYQKLVMQTVFDSANTPDKLKDMMLLGVNGEAGELTEMEKKERYHHAVWVREDWLNELGDLQYYLAGLARAHGFSLAEVMANNVTKLSRRHGELLKQRGHTG